MPAIKTVKMLSHENQRKPGQCHEEHAAENDASDLVHLISSLANGALSLNGMERSTLACAAPARCRLQWLVGTREARTDRPLAKQRPIETTRFASSQRSADSARASTSDT